MASSILSQGKEKIQEVMSAKDQKATNLAANTKDVHDPSWRITSDWGVKQTNTDDWLKVATDDKTGPMLLEDGFSREKVRRHPPLYIAYSFSHNHRSTALTTNAFPNVLFTHEVLAPSESSPSSNQQQTSHVRKSSQIRPERHLYSFDSPLFLVAVAQQTPSAMSVVSLSSSTQRRVTGILLETTFPSSSSRML